MSSTPILDTVMADRCMTLAPRPLGAVRTDLLVTVCPLDGAVLDDAGDCGTCPPEHAGLARRVIEIRRAAFEVPVVVTYTGHGIPLALERAWGVVR